MRSKIPARAVAVAALATVALGGLGLAGCTSSGGIRQQGQAAAPVQATPPGTQQQPAQTASPSTGASGATVTAEQLVAQKCATCHPVSTVLNNRSKNAAMWGKIIDNMTQRGAQVTPQQKAAIIEYLTKR